MAEVARGLRRSLAVAARHGIAADRVVVDPGFGFGKTPAQNLELIQRLGELGGIGCPLLLGASRKSTIGLLLGGAPPELRWRGRWRSASSPSPPARRSCGSTTSPRSAAASGSPTRYCGRSLRRCAGTCSRADRVSSTGPPVVEMGLDRPGLQRRPPWGAPGLPPHRSGVCRDHHRGRVEGDPHPPRRGHRPGRLPQPGPAGPQPRALAGRALVEAVRRRGRRLRRRPTYRWGPRRADADLILLGRRGEIRATPTPPSPIPGCPSAPSGTGSSPRSTRGRGRYGGR